MTAFQPVTRPPLTAARVGFVILVVALLGGQLVAAQQPAPSATLEGLLLAHRAWNSPPLTIEITGTSKTTSKEGEPVSEPVRILATGNEETITEYGALRGNKAVATSSAVFRDNGEKVTFGAAPAGFSQLDVTGVFFLARLASTPFTPSPAVAAEMARTPAQKVTISRNRSQKHYGQFKVDDTFDVFIGQNGLLAGIARSFYPSTSSRHYTEGYMFEDYRETSGVLLPYRIAKYHKGRRVQIIEVERYEFNLGADPALFKARSVR
jgi:hypothetical protein